MSRFYNPSWSGFIFCILLSSLSTFLFLFCIPSRSFILFSVKISVNHQACVIVYCSMSVTHPRCNCDLCIKIGEYLAFTIVTMVTITPSTCCFISTPKTIGIFILPFPFTLTLSSRHHNSLK